MNPHPSLIKLIDVLQGCNVKIHNSNNAKLQLILCTDRHPIPVAQAFPNAKLLQLLRGVIQAVMADVSITGSRGFFLIAGRWHRQQAHHHAVLLRVAHDLLGQLLAFSSVKENCRKDYSVLLQETLHVMLHVLLVSHGDLGDAEILSKAFFWKLPAFQTV